MLDVAILGLLLDGDHHGYELKKRLTELLGPWSSVSFGSLYPALSRLERDDCVATVEPSDDDDGSPSPMSGSLGAELAAFRRGRTGRSGRPSGRRARKVYTITDHGRLRLDELLTDASGDERSFAVRVAFCGHLDPQRRLGLFRERRRLVSAKAGDDRPATPGDRYRRSLLEFQRDRHLRELAWLDQLIQTGEHDAEHDADPTDADTDPDTDPIDPQPHDTPVLTPHGGNES